MSKKETKIEETMETVEVKEVAEVEETQEEKKPGLLTKVINKAKANGPKVVKAGKAIAIGAVVGVVGYALGRKSGLGSGGSTSDDYDYDLEVIDCSDYSVEEAE